MPAMQAARIVPGWVPTSGWQFLPDDGLRARRTAVSLPQAPRRRGAGTHDWKDLPYRSAVDRDSERRPPKVPACPDRTPAIGTQSAEQISAGDRTNLRDASSADKRD